MKKYVSGFLFFLCLTSACLITLFWLTSNGTKEEAKKVQATESVEQPTFAEREAETMMHLVLNQEHVTAAKSEEKFCLVAENGYLIVYNDMEKTVHMFTHMPLAEFPEPEQEKLMEGIWFPTMTEIFSYLESYSS